MLHKALKLIRQFHELKQVDLADRIGISKSYLSELESGKKVISIDILNKYSEAFDIPVSSLVFFSESIDSKGLLPISFKKMVAGKIINIMEWVVSRDEASKIKAT